MESRKLIKFGNSSYVITLPFEWLRKHGLDRGAELDLQETENGLILKLQEEVKEKEVSISIDDKPFKLFNRQLISFYLKNYRRINIKGENILEKLEEIKRTIEKLSSVEITEISKEKIVVQDLTNISALDVHKLISEIVELEKTILDELIESKKENNHYFITSLDTTINKLSFLAYKAINENFSSYKAPAEIKDGIHYWRIIASLEQCGDIMKRLSRYLQDKALQEENNPFIQSIEHLKEYFCFVTDLLHNPQNQGKNLVLAHDKKQSLFKEFEELKELLKDERTLSLVITQLFKDLLGEMDKVIISVIDLRNK